MADRVNAPNAEGLGETVEVRIEDLDGMPLDWMVAKVEGLYIDDEGVVHTEEFWWDDEGLSWEVEYRPTIDWAQAGLIIEREGVCLLEPCSNQNRNEQWHASCGSWGLDGPTPLIAAMRCFVASKLGNEVEVPRKLVQRVTTLETAAPDSHDTGADEPSTRERSRG